MGGTLWFWVVILFTSVHQPVSKIRSRIPPLLTSWIRISRIYVGCQPWDRYIKWENCSWISVIQTEPGFTFGQTRSNSRAHLPLEVRQPDPTLVRISSETGQNWAFGSTGVKIYSWLLCARILTYLFSLLHNSPWRWELLFPKKINFFFRKGNWVSEIVGNLPKPIQLINGTAKSLTNLKAYLLKKRRVFNCWQCKETSKKKFSNVTTDPSTSIHLLVSRSGAQLQTFGTASRNQYNKRAALGDIFHRKHLSQYFKDCKVSQ